MSWVNLAEALRVPRQKKVHLTLGEKITGVRKRTIYALTDPADQGIRYIGVTTRDLSWRLKLHLQKPTNAGMRGWFADRRRRGLRPTITRLEQVSPSEWEAAERGWIHWCRERGDLLNVDRGGQARTRTGALRGFVAGAYQPPTGSAPVAPMKISLNAPESPCGGAMGRESRPERRPRLVPVSAGVFRRA